MKSESLSRYKHADKELTQMIKGFKTDLSSKLATYEKSDFPSIEHLKETLFNKIDGMRDDIKIMKHVSDRKFRTIKKC